ncbi:MAG: YafY family protein [Chloroflexota bacterium]
MYSPTARLLAVLELLQSNKRMSGAEMARRLEVNVRTIRRYITTLQDMGIPIEGERGPLGAYELQRGHRLPPLLYTEEEAVALALGLIVLQVFDFPVNAVSVEGALAKTERVIPEDAFQRVQSLRKAITFNQSAYTIHAPSLLNNEFVVKLSSAIHEKQSVHLSYRSWQGKQTERAVDPYALVYNEGYWYMVGYCHLRDDLRTFRLDRIHEVIALADKFEQVSDINPLEHVLKSIALSPNVYSVEIILYTSLQEAKSVFSLTDGILEEVQDRVILRRNTAELEWLAYTLLYAPFRVQVNHPPELRQKLVDLSKKALEMSQEPRSNTA